ncbi:excinuclease ABC subunit UvrA [Alkalibacter rhizosphaerae]|uniref:UvrABC system protein A n=1 Tax=Alkalibacter rhizosphaerae TaxID=2815577 RepID=A0A974XGA4_9FIRM|nr:excinuclease ABC subunit UvrA [Alkalibacter rhizosphaerae]QSX08190.1 excinuclease ABC subunit UvrA [Alkalibacter rhizosphaerae]
MDRINIVGAKEHNLKNINITLPRDEFIVFTGLSGSGKSSLAFDTIYAEGQRRYVESLSSYARQFLGQMSKPDVDYIEGLSPAISIDQKTTNRNPRSTVGTVTEIYDYFRLLFARIGVPHCPSCGKEISAQTVDQIVESVESLPEGTRFLVLSPVVRGEKGQHKKLLEAIKRDGFVRVVVDGETFDLNEETIELDKNKKHSIDIVVDRLIRREGMAKRLTDSVETALKLGDGMVYIDEMDGQRHLYSEKFACGECGIAMDKLEPRMFSFNNPFGMCMHCNGLGSHKQVDPDLLIRDRSLSFNKGALNFFGAKEDSTYYNSIVSALADLYDFSMDQPLEEAPETFMDALFYGEDRPLQITFNSYFGGWKEREVVFEGLINNMERRHKETSSDYMRSNIEKYMSDIPCNVCKGKRLNDNSLAVTVKGRNIIELTDLAINDCLDFFDTMELTDRESAIAVQVLKEIRSRLQFLIDVGLDYLTLSRNAGTLSGGESQRIRLATQIGSALVGVLYVLDEPSIGLHQRDNSMLLATLRNLTNLGNTLIVVEHDEDTIRAADHVVDIGPGAGIHGGHVIAQGHWEEIVEVEESVTGQYLSGKREIPVPQQRREGTGEEVVIRGAAENNLKNIDVAIPLGKFVAITGVSGSGKSTLINEILYKGVNKKVNRSWNKVGKHKTIEGIEHLDKVIDIDQSPIGRTPRSNPATYTGVFDHIRDLFAQTPEAKMRGYKKGRFSFNVKGGRCENCKGDGIIQIEMHFLPDVYVPCEVCKGKRYNKETLQVKYKGKNISDVLEMTVEEGVEFFQNITRIHNKLATLYDVGLGYIKLGQPSTQLSGGEAQRIKLATELSKRGTGKTLYILDEPTTGLHMADVDKLISVLNQLADSGNTIVVIEHNLDVIKVADHVIDLGPEGGFRGGTVIAQGTPEEIAQVPRSFTGQFLKRVLHQTDEGGSRHG